MTPEERFERIEKTLDRMAAESAASAKENSARLAEHDARLSRIERTCEFLADSQAQLTAGLAELRNDVVKLVGAVGSLEIGH